MTAVAISMLRRVAIDAGIFVLRIGNINRLLLRAAVALALVLVLSPAARARVGTFMRDRGFFVLALAAALWLSLGPAPRTLGRPLELAAPYGLLFDYVPGFDGLRAPARLAMIVAFLLALVAGYGADVIGRMRRGQALLGVLGAAFLLESTLVPFPVNGMEPPRGFNAPEARLYRPARAPAVYRQVAQQAPDGVLAELPLGYPDFDLRAMYYSTVHRRPVLNGYSGYFPRHYGQLLSALSDVPRDPALSLEALQASGATHALVHEAAYLGAEGPETSAALMRLGGSELFRDGTDVLLALPPVP